MDGEALAMNSEPLEDELYEKAGGLWWPKYDIECRFGVAQQLPDLLTFTRMCPQRRVVVQAGGNVGVWPKNFARFFDSVYTFEPDPWNWECLRRNVDEPNVLKYNVALGSAPGRVSIQAIQNNCGANYVIKGDDVPVITIDSLNVPHCDLLQLDVEGYEWEALKGAEQTLLKHSPLIVLEQKGHGMRYGATDEQITQWLRDRDYRMHARVHRDTVFKRVGNAHANRVVWK